MSQSAHLSSITPEFTRQTSTSKKARSEPPSSLHSIAKKEVLSASKKPLQTGIGAKFCMENSQARCDLYEPKLHRTSLECAHSGEISTVRVLSLKAADENVCSSSVSYSIPSNGRGRRRGRGAGRVASRSMRTSVTFQHKLEVIDFFESHAKDINATVQHFYAHLDPIAIASRKRQIYKWVKSRATIEEMCFKKTTSHQTRRRDKGTATTLPDVAEKELAKWIKEDQAQNSQLSTQMLRLKAMEIAENYDIPKGTFQATWTWQKGFFKRHQISI
uniref:Uncharacterized protein AlNc14C51G3984 n=1 Tax=Albugo laibachii Nc14 TaxID=890382 RepID=F0WBD7_9STRA|nr:conserved hypothetical protein [Albugo laibachii Nc14]|eukprot:CCA18461.1 conserved hypothetical protein [Albugo laibachii Nc14]